MATPYDPIQPGVGYKYPDVTPKNLAEMLPFFFNDLTDIIPNVNVANRIIAAIVKCVRLGEDKFQQAFGGWMPASNQFGIVPLRPPHLSYPDNRWIWTSGGTSSKYWSASDTMVSVTGLNDKAILLIYGYFNLEPVPNTLEIWINPGSTKYPIWSVVPLRLNPKQRYFVLPTPIIIEPNSALTIYASCANTSTSEECGYLGYYFAPLSRLIDVNVMET